MARRNGRKRRQQVRAVQALVDKLKREQAVAAATHAYPALSCPVRLLLAKCQCPQVVRLMACKHAIHVVMHFPSLEAVSAGSMGTVYCT